MARPQSLVASFIISGYDGTLELTMKRNHDKGVRYCTNRMKITKQACNHSINPIDLSIKGFGLSVSQSNSLKPA